jgi:peptidoglycan/LPS O-acetylase OafA/YrhL
MLKVNKIQVNKSKYIASLTSIRGIAALWVVAYHYWNDVVLLFPIFNFFTPLLSVGNYAVPLFFILSGFIMAYNYEDTFIDLNWKKYFKFLSFRLAQIYPVHICTLIFVLCMVIVARIKGISIDNSGYALETFIQNFFLVHTWVPSFKLNWNYPSWSISSEWFAYIWFPIVSAFIFNRLKSLNLVIVLLIATWLACIAIYATETINFKELIVVIPTFLTGMLLYKLRTHWHPSNHPSALIPDFCLILIILTPFLCNGIVLISVYISLFIVIILSLAILQNSCSQYWKSPPLMALGKTSYSLYMSHTIAQKLCYILVPVRLFSQSSLLTKVGILGLYSLAIAGFCVATYFLIEKPGRRYFRHISDKLY